MMTLAAAILLSRLQEAAIEVPFRMAPTAIIADATVNGKPLSFMFDTGFSGSFVVDDSVNLGKATGKMRLRDFVGEFEADTVKLQSVKLGAKSIDPKEMEAVVQPVDYSFSYSTHCDGIMGFEVVRDSVVEINFQRSRFVFHPRSLDISKRVADGKRTFLLKMLPIGHSSIELEAVASNGKKMVLALDTGNSFFATTHRDVLERVGLWSADRKPAFMKSSFVASGAVDSWHKKMENVQIFGVPVPVSYWDILDLPSSSAEHDGTVGFGFLKNFNITIDYERRRVWMENFTGVVGNEPEGEPGFAAAYSERSKKVFVVDVAPDSPAAKAGVQEGDVVLSIDGKELIGTIGYREVEAMISGKVGTKVTVNFSRRGQLNRLELERAALVND